MMVGRWLTCVWYTDLSGLKGHNTQVGECWKMTAGKTGLTAVSFSLVSPRAQGIEA